MHIINGYTQKERERERERETERERERERERGRGKEGKNQEELARFHQRNFENFQLMRKILVVEYFW